MLITDSVELMRQVKNSSGKTWAQVRYKLGRGKCNIISLAYRGRAMVESYVDIMDALGYDVEIHAVKKGKSPENKRGEN